MKAYLEQLAQQMQSPPYEKEGEVPDGGGASDYSAPKLNDDTNSEDDDSNDDEPDSSQRRLRMLSKERDALISGVHSLAQWTTSRCPRLSP